MKDQINIAIVQEGPVYNDLPQSLKKLEALATEAVSNGAELLVFGETWLCGYPAWLDHCPNMALWDHWPTKQVFVQMLKSSVTVPGVATQFISKLAKEKSVVIGVGVNEKIEAGAGQGTIYNSFLLFDSIGNLVVHHRKLMPTYTEKLVHGLGDGRGLHAADTSIGRIGGLICWEHFMPLARQAMHDSGELIHLALWPKVHEMLQIASRQYAFEARCFVIAAGQMMRVRDIPPELDLPPHLIGKPDDWILNGGSCVIGPDGFFELEPQFDKEGIIYHTIKNPERALGERMSLDISGHYQRPDIFEFKLKKEN